MARREDTLRALAEDIARLPQPHGEFIACVGDAGLREDVQQAVAATVAHFGRLDIAIANAGIGHRGAVADARWQDLQALLRLNIDGVLHTIQAAVPPMRQSGRGHIMIVSSVAASMISPYAATYAASKAFVSSIAQSIRVELRKDNILVSDFLVGRTDTSFNENRLGEGARKASRLPAMTPEQVAAGMVAVAQRPRSTVILRWFDRLIVWGNRWLPGVIGYLAARQYR
jgi:short-subunit dehydrogenase